jgi:nucleoside 2-deoxyribosyltransferase
MKKKIKVYVAGPYTKGDPAANVRTAILAGNELYDVGFVPFIPHLNHLWHMLEPRPYPEWLAYDMEWLDVCDVVLRLPGPSYGAQREVERAREQGKPVFHSIEDLKMWEREQDTAEIN